MTPPSTTRPILERLAYACYLALLASSICITWQGALIGWETGQYHAMFMALGGLALSRWLHLHGHAHWHFRQCGDSLDMRSGPGLMPRSEHEQALAEQMAALFAQMEAEDDVWVRGALRREIVARLAASPTLREEFTEALAAHPEL